MHSWHYVPRAPRGELLARDERELLELRRRFFAAFPSLLAMCAMPDHVHLLLPRPASPRFLGHLLSEYARWRNGRRGDRGPVWRPLDAPSESVGEAKRRRDIRYIHLNPCRARLVADPLAWPASTHRDATGLALWPAVRPAPDPDTFHAWVSGDPSVSVRGTLLPTRSMVSPTLEAVRAATSALCHVTDQELMLRCPARTVLLRAARALTTATDAEIAAFTNVSRRTVAGAVRTVDPHLARIAAAAGDERFALIGERAVPAWERYRQWRADRRD